MKWVLPGLPMMDQAGLSGPGAHQAPSEGRRPGWAQGSQEHRTQGPTGVKVPPRAGQALLAVSVGTVPGPRQPHSGPSVGIGAATNARAAGQVPRGRGPGPDPAGGMGRADLQAVLGVSG